MMKRIVLCADDYGQAEAVSRGILELIAASRITATSCLVTMPGWHEHAQWLKPYQDRTDIGLHLNFTEGSPLSAQYRNYAGDKFQSLSTVMWATLLRKSVPVEVLRAEINAQLDRFEQGMGCPPAFIDGHQHIHYLPLIRDALLAVYRERLQRHGVYVRSISQHLLGVIGSADIRRSVIYFSGGAAYSSFLDKNGIPHNADFSGFYPFRKSGNYRSYFLRFLRNTRDGGLIMCHPGLQAANNGSDLLRRSRFDEYQYFSSTQFVQDCKEMHVIPSRFVSLRENKVYDSRLD